MSGKPELRLGFAFDPIPKWIGARYEAGELSAERRDILIALFRRADYDELAGRKPGPTLRLESLAAAIHRGTDRVALDALRRTLNNMRGDGELDYTTRGTGRRVVYVFTLRVEPPEPRSGVIPRSEPSSVPGSDAPQPGTGSGIAESGADARSGVAARGDGRPVPGSTSPIPGSGRAANPHGERDPGVAADGAIPTSPDAYQKDQDPHGPTEADVVVVRRAVGTEPGGDAQQQQLPIRTSPDTYDPRHA